MLILAAAASVQQAAIQPSKGLTINVSPEIALHYPNGIETIRVFVSPEGLMSTCMASIEGRGRVVDQENCNKLVHFKAQPASDQNGQTAYGMAEVKLSWSVFKSGEMSHSPSLLPPPEPDLYLPLSRLPSGLRNNATSGLILVAGSDGKVETCQVQQTSGVTALDDAACHAVVVAGVTPPKNAVGEAVRAVHSVRVGFSVHP